MKLTSSQRRYLVLYQCLLPMLINIVVCGLIGAVDYRGLNTLPVLEPPKSVAVDLAATSFLLPFLTCLIATPLVRRDIRRGTVSSLAKKDQQPSAGLPPARMPLLLRALLIGGTGAVVVGSAAMIVVSMLPVPTVAVSKFLFWKLTFAGFYGAAVTPFIALLAMAEPAESL
ncbi:MAG: hypothetical protein R3C19_21485 [Planctomycetaceae bacterium]